MLGHLKERKQAQKDIFAQLRNDGWDDVAMIYYVNNCYHMAKTGSWQQALRWHKKQVKQIGSPLYTKMFYLSNLPIKEKLHLPIHQMSGELDNFNMLQLSSNQNENYVFWTCLGPHSQFSAYYAHLVRLAYGHYTSYAPLNDPLVHQFRYYLDRQHIQYIRRFFVGKVDGEKLFNYGKHCPFLTKKQSLSFEATKIQLYFKEPARYHNRYIEKQYPGRKNSKVLTLNRHGEFILDIKGNFVTQWDLLEFNEKQQVISDPNYYQKIYQNKPEKLQLLANTESFNYASHGGKSQAHYYLDILPASSGFGLESDLRKQIKQQWIVPKVAEYYK